MNEARIESNHFRFPIIILTIKAPFRERIKIFSDPLLDGKQESRNKIQEVERRNIKNREKMMTLPSWKNGLFGSLYKYLVYMSKE